MKLRHNAWQIPLRLASGAFMLNSGISKRGVNEEVAAGLHGFAQGSYPFLNKIDAQEFTQTLSVSEIVIGSALLLPIVPSRIAGAGLTGFSLGLLGLYLRTPGMRQEGSLRPTEQGIALAKDSWLLAIGLSLLTGGLVNRREKLLAAKQQ